MKQESRIPPGEYPAFPESGLSGSTSGLTKREYFAAMAMQSICAGYGAEMVANRDERYDETNWKEIVALNSVEIADALIERLAKESTGN